MRTDEIALLMQMRAEGETWPAIEKKIGYSISNMRKVYALHGGEVLPQRQGRHHNLCLRLHRHELEEFRSRGGPKWLRSMLSAEVSK